MRSRFTCRAFLPDLVPSQTIREIVHMAGQAASWCNIQPWEVVIASGSKIEDFRTRMLAETEREPTPDVAFPPGYEGVFRDRRRETGYALYTALDIARDDHQRRRAQTDENFRLFGAPHVAIVTTEAAIGPYGLVDCGGFIAGFLLAARAHGVDTAPQAALARHAALIHELFEIGPERQVVCGISFGYADRHHPANGFRTRRAPLEEIARFV